MKRPQRYSGAGPASRVLLTLLAAAMVLWLVLAARDNILLARGVRETSMKAIEQNAVHAESDLKAARLLNPDVYADLNLALLYSITERRKQALQLAERVVREEPQNAFALTSLFAIANGYDDRVAERTLAAIQRVDPLISRSG